MVNVSRNSFILPCLFVTLAIASFLSQTLIVSRYSKQKLHFHLHTVSSQDIINVFDREFGFNKNCEPLPPEFFFSLPHLSADLSLFLMSANVVLWKSKVFFVGMAQYHEHFKEPTRSRMRLRSPTSLNLTCFFANGERTTVRVVDPSIFTMECDIPRHVVPFVKSSRYLRLFLLNSSTAYVRNCSSAYVSFPHLIADVKISLPVLINAAPLPKVVLAACSYPMHNYRSPFLSRQWIEYHWMMGVRHFIHYNADPIDAALRRDLASYENRGMLSFRRWHVPELEDHKWALQTSAMNDCLYLLSDYSEWIIFDDTDEFPYPLMESSLHPFLLREPATTAALILLSQVYEGERNNASRFNYTFEKWVLRAPSVVSSGREKIIVRVCLVDSVFIHWPGKTNGNIIRLNPNEIRMNHYYHSQYGKGRLYSTLVEDLGIIARFGEEFHKRMCGKTLREVAEL